MHGELQKHLKGYVVTLWIRESNWGGTTIDKKYVDRALWPMPCRACRENLHLNLVKSMCAPTADPARPHRFSCWSTH